MENQAALATPTTATHHPGIDTSPVTRFDLEDSKSWVDYLLEHGYVVVKSVATKEQIREAHSKLWDFLEPTMGWKRDNPKTWKTGGLASVGDPMTGIIHSGGAGQCDFQWYVRCLPKVKRAFQTIWSRVARDTKRSDLDPEKLITSFDGINVFRPWLRHPSWKTSDGWTHVDQGDQLTGLHCVQGLVTLTDATAKTGGFVALPGSHKHHAAIVDSIYCAVDNYVEVPLDYYSKLLPKDTTKTLRFVSAEAFDMILWDSRTIHANIPALDDPSDVSADHLLMAVSYVCMTPRALASEEILKGRRRAFEESRTTSHWPHFMRSNNNNGFDGYYDQDDYEVEVENSRLAKASQAIKDLVG